LSNRFHSVERGFRPVADDSNLARSFDDHADFDATDVVVELESEIGEDQIRDEFSSYSRDTRDVIVDKAIIDSRAWIPRRAMLMSTSILIAK
jgi:hypothetical protein